MVVETLPRWNLDALFPSLDGPEYAAAVERTLARLADLASFMETGAGMAPGESMQASAIGLTDGLAVTADVVGTCDDLLTRINELSEDLQRISAYPRLLTSTDTRNEAAKARLSELQTRTVVFDKLMKRFAAWIGSLDVETLIAASPLARAHAYFLQHTHEAARHLMSPAEEDLFSELFLSGGRAWNRLWTDVSSQVPVEFTVRGERRRLPMAQARRLATDPDPEVRRAAYEGEMAAWKSVEVPCAAALNSVKGEAITLVARRRWADPLDAALFSNHMDRATLDALLASVAEALPTLRRYLLAKARALGKDRLAWYDLLAPVGEAPPLSWDGARDLILEQFGRYGPKMGGLARRAFDEQWIDAAQGEAKVDGAFCSPILPGESRVLLTFEPSLNSASTLAHELGHAYHNLNLKERTPLQRRTPSILAETASTFCETIVSRAAQAAADSPAARLVLLEAELQRGQGIIVDVYARFLFESRVFARRAARDLAPSEFVELMTAAQREAFADGLSEHLHPYLWAAKPHFYFPWNAYYNFPYIFGLLFGLGLYARYADDPEGFLGAYDDLLSSTGLADAPTLAARFGIDVRTPAFWRSSLDVVRETVAQFEALVGP